MAPQQVALFEAAPDGADPDAAAPVAVAPDGAVDEDAMNVARAKTPT